MEKLGQHEEEMACQSLAAQSPATVAPTPMCIQTHERSEGEPPTKTFTGSCPTEIMRNNDYCSKPLSFG